MFRSSYPEVEIPDIPVTEYVLGRDGDRGDRPALVDGATRRTLTYAQLAEAVTAAGGGLPAGGSRKATSSPSACRTSLSTRWRSM